MSRVSQWSLLSVLVIGLVWSATVSAQVGPAPNPPPPRSAAAGSGAAEAPAAAQPSVYPAVPAITLLNMASVQEELRMTGPQKQQLRTLNDQLSQANQPDATALNQLQDGQEARANQLQQRMLQRWRMFERQVQQVLQPSQWAQLERIAFHLSVTQALAIPQVAAQIRLTAEQSQRVQQINAAAVEKYFQIQRQVAEQVLQSLSPQQQQVLQSLNTQATRGGGQ